MASRSQEGASLHWRRSYSEKSSRPWKKYPTPKKTRTFMGMEGFPAERTQKSSDLGNQFCLIFNAQSRAEFSDNLRILFRKTQGGCGGLGGENPAAFPRAGPIFQQPFSLPASAQTLALVAPYRAILRYYRCDTPYRAILFKGGLHSPKKLRYPPVVLSFTQAHLCDTPFCNVSRDTCAIPHKNKHEKVLRYYRYKYRAIWKVSLLGL